MVVILFQLIILFNLVYAKIKLCWCIFCHFQNQSRFLDFILYPWITIFDKKLRLTSIGMCYCAETLNLLQFVAYYTLTRQLVYCAIIELA